MHPRHETPLIGTTTGLECFPSMNSSKRGAARKATIRRVGTSRLTKDDRKLFLDLGMLARSNCESENLAQSWEPRTL